jgi:hypothetical protein
MTDLALGYAAQAAVAIVLFLVTLWLARRLSVAAANGVNLLVVAALLDYIRCIWFDSGLAAWLPWSNLIVIGNWLPLFLAVIAALVWLRTAYAPCRRAVLCSALAACGTFAGLYPVLGFAPRCENRWDDLGTCVQTTPYTCSPACAATLLAKYGIRTTEAEMADLCLTRYGTSWQGLYRGLKLKTAGTQWDVQVCDVSADDLMQQDGGPMILSVGLPADASANTEYTREFGWVPGVNHSVVLECWQPGELARVSDPQDEMAREHWDLETMRILFRGTMLRLVPRAAQDKLRQVPVNCLP